jgi:hypothetical protein
MAATRPIPLVHMAIPNNSKATIATRVFEMTGTFFPVTVMKTTAANNKAKTITLKLIDEGTEPVFISNILFHF